jgi:hypothetical protein
MVIPRENNMVRLYIQLASSSDKDWNPRRAVSTEEVARAAKRIMRPYYIEWDRVEWYSVYPIGQGIAERYTLDERVFMGGDCCHTHSPKAGQGMNTAFLDAANLAWKIHHVESGLADRSILSTYESERKSVAESLLTFDAKYAKLFSERQPTAGEVGSASVTKPSGSDEEESAEDSSEFIKVFKESCEFTSGYGVAYGPNVFNWSPSHPAQSPLFLTYPEHTALRTGRVLPPCTVTRVVDANRVHLEQEIPLNGAFRVLIFGGSPSKTRRALADFNNFLKRRSFYNSFTRSDVDRVSYHEKYTPHSHFFTFATIYAASRSEIEIQDSLPAVLRRYRDLVYADDRPDPRVPNAKAAAHKKYGIDDETGAIVVVRPDGYVGCVVKLVEGSGTVDALNAYFGSFVTKKLGEEVAQL